MTEYNHLEGNFYWPEAASSRWDITLLHSALAEEFDESTCPL
jgi:hypothetical protein